MIECHRTPHPGPTTAMTTPAPLALMDPSRLRYDPGSPRLMDLPDPRPTGEPEITIALLKYLDLMSSIAAGGFQHPAPPLVTLQGALGAGRPQGLRRRTPPPDSQTRTSPGPGPRPGGGYTPYSWTSQATPIQAPPTRGSTPLQDQPGKERHSPPHQGECTPRCSGTQEKKEASPERRRTVTGAVPGPGVTVVPMHEGMHLPACRRNASALRFPTREGMHPSGDVEHLPNTRFPHKRGDAPSRWFFPQRVSVVPPQARGCTRHPTSGSHDPEEPPSTGRCTRYPHDRVTAQDTPAHGRPITPDHQCPECPDRPGTIPQQVHVLQRTATAL